MSIETNRRDPPLGNVVSAATAFDYLRDPTRWGSAEMAAYFPGFEHLDIRTSGAVIRLRYRGSRSGQQRSNRRCSAVVSRRCPARLRYRCSARRRCCSRS